MVGVVITPYHRESLDVLLRCIDSVRAQYGAHVQHVLVSDGPDLQYQVFAGYRSITHLATDRRANDWGNAPRARGLSASLSADFVAFLDADNFYDPDHIAMCLKVAEQNPGCDYVVARERYMRRTNNGTLIPSHAKHEPQDEHVDFSEFFLLPQCYDIALNVLTNVGTGDAKWWADTAGVDLHETIKRFKLCAPSYIGDRCLYHALKKAGMRGAFVNRDTLTYVVSALPPSEKHPV